MIRRLVETLTYLALVVSLLVVTSELSTAQTLEERLLAERPETLVDDARSQGDPVRGAVLFHQPYLGCTRCHAAGAEGKPLGPDLSRLEKETKAPHLVESVLAPSRQIRKGFQTIVLELKSGKTQTGLLVESDPTGVSLRDVDRGGKTLLIPRAEIEDQKLLDQSLMPAGLVNLLASRQQFLDLTAYLLEIAEKGPVRALELQPNPALYAAAALPEYEQHLDHRGLILGWNDASLSRGEAIYNRVCANCHGTHERAGSLPTSLKFATGKFKNGAEPYAMYQTLTRGFGLMAPQTWMVPRQKYDVLHYIRERYLRERNPTQYAPVDDDYLATLPKGDTQGPKPSTIEPWSAMDYGTSLIGTYEVGADASNFAYKGIAIRLDAGSGGISRGDHFQVFDHDTLRIAAAWSRQPGKPGFIDWHSILFDGQHGVHPRLVGEIAFGNRTGPGWANPANGSWADPRIRGRDDRPYGPLPRDWAHYRGMYQYGQQVVLSYTVGTSEILESPGIIEVGGAMRDGKTAPLDGNLPGTPVDPENAPASVVFGRTFHIGPRTHDLLLRVAERSDPNSKLNVFQHDATRLAIFGLHDTVAESTNGPPDRAVVFDGGQFLEVPGDESLDFLRQDLTILARVRTKQGGTVLCQTQPGDKWIPGGKSLFIRDGRLCFDMGWVGAVSSRKNVNDGEWHAVACTWNHKTGEIELFIDGVSDGKGTLKPQHTLDHAVLRIGFTAPDFPQPQSAFVGDMAFVRLYPGRLANDDIRRLSESRLTTRGESNATLRPQPLAAWNLSGARGTRVDNAIDDKHTAVVRDANRKTAAAVDSHPLVAGVVSAPEGTRWESEEGRLILRIPAGDQPLRMTVWASAAAAEKIEEFAKRVVITDPDRDLQPLTHGGPPRWSEKLVVPVRLGRDEGPYAADVLTLPDANPWLALVRPTGLDFLEDGDRLAVCTWDGDVWMIAGLSKLPASVTEDPVSSPPALTWQRIASGLFQPLGLKIVQGKIHVTCRDQLVILHDLNGDGETDYYENFNNDHQVTEHFHEFAMGLQTDAEGNFYYAKSARHALKAVVPHHGTLLKIPRDGSRTEILATGFRAANGVCLNPDGSFIVTDQEGHWNPKNRINRVEPGKFYGNMFGYHDVTNAADSAMEPPLCWITNSFDRSPAELLWVTSDKWGPLKGSLLNFSYGYGKIFVVPHEEVRGLWQGGMVELPLPPFPTGLIRGRFSPFDGQLYACGMFAWAGSATQAGGLYRVRATGRPVYVPLELHATSRGVTLKFSGLLDPTSINEEGAVACKVWGLKRSANYGSEHVNEHRLEVRRGTLDPDGRTLRLEIPEIGPTWGMEIRYSLRSSDGRKVQGMIHNTIHTFGSDIDGG